MNNNNNKHGGLFTYTHFNNKVVGVVKLTCQTDFAEKTEAFKQLAGALASQAAASSVEDVDSFLKEECIFDDGTVKDQVEKLEKALKEKINIESILKIQF